MKRWTEDLFTSFILQQFIATVGAMFLGILSVAIPALFVAAVTKNPAGGNIADRMVDVWVFRIADAPYFAGPILAALILGLFSRRIFPDRAAAVVWLLPMLILGWNVMTWHAGGPFSRWHGVWNDFFSSDCGSSECLYEFFVTGPFYTSVAYTSGWLVGRRMDKRRRQAETGSTAQGVGSV